MGWQENKDNATALRASFLKSMTSQKAENPMVNVFICLLATQPEDRKLLLSIQSNLQAAYQFCSRCRWHAFTPLSLPVLLEGYMFPPGPGSHLAVTPKHGSHIPG